MKDAQFVVSTPYILDKMVASLSDESLGLNDKDMMGDCYEYLLSKMARGGDNGQFRTPRHIIDMMVELAKSTLADTIIEYAFRDCTSLTSIVIPRQCDHYRLICLQSLRQFDKCDI